MPTTFRLRAPVLGVSMSLTTALTLTLALSACQGDKAETAKQQVAKQQEISTTGAATGKAKNTQKVLPLRELVSMDKADVVKPAYLRDILPDTAFTYVRIPNVWSLVGTAKGNTFDKAFNAKPFVEAVKSIRAGMRDNVIPEILDKDAHIFSELIFHHVTSPVELLGVEPVDPAIPTPNLVASMAMDFSSTDELQTFLNELAEKQPMVKVTKAVTATGYAELSLANMSTQLQWDKATSRVTILVGASLSPNNLSDFISTLKPNPAHPMKAIEASIDSSGEGFFAWVDPRKTTNLANALGMQRELAPLAVFGVAAMKNMALGMGTSGGINRLKYVLDMPVTGFRSYMPTIKTAPTFDVIGKTNMVGVFGLPSRADYTAIENTIAMVSKPTDMKGYYDGKKSFKEALGFEIEDLFDFFGQDVSYVSDEAGSYMAVRLNDAEKFKATLEASTKKLNLHYQQREIAGHTYHHLKIPSLFSKYAEEEQAKAANGERVADDKLAMRFLSLPSHVFWEQEGDYLILSNIPQTLMDRHYIETRTPVEDWFEKQQRISPEGALLMFSLNSEGTSKKIYRMQLSALNTLADFVGKPLDLFALATPLEAKLPKQSSYGMKLSSSPKQLAFELNYESNPLEVGLAGGSYQGVAMVGILAAIAVPAYQDYTVRSEMAVSFAAAEDVKTSLEEFRLENDRFPNEAEIEDFNRYDDKFEIEVTDETGEIIINYSDESAIGSDYYLLMTPIKDDLLTTWECDTDIPQRHIPRSSECRYE